MRILLTRLTSSHHRLEVVRGDGSRSSADLETRSHLLHDFIHYAVEAEARLDQGFWGLLARGTPIEELQERARAQGPSPHVELALAESIAGPVNSLIHGKTDAAGLVRAFHELFAASGNTIPPWLTEGFLVRVMDRLRRLLGQWKATPFGGTLELHWPAEAPQ